LRGQYIDHKYHDWCMFITNIVRTNLANNNTCFCDYIRDFKNACRYHKVKLSLGQNDGRNFSDSCGKAVEKLKNWNEGVISICSLEQFSN